MLGPSAHIDTFARDNLPPAELRPDFLLAGFDYPERLNVAVELTDRMVQKGFGDNTALIGNGRRRTYKELTDWTNRLARALVGAESLEYVGLGLALALAALWLGRPLGDLSDTVAQALQTWPVNDSELAGLGWMTFLGLHHEMMWNKEPLENNGTNVTVVKSALALLGQDCGHVRPPGAWPLTERQSQELRSRLGEWGLLAGPRAVAG